ncbi:hypothetical protein TNCV_4247191 [Trichonephila clavipes]|nr:hypothetical protein TNCV_4247191 [Trichonephila clavipes]
MEWLLHQKSLLSGNPRTGKENNPENKRGDTIHYQSVGLIRKTGPILSEKIKRQKGWCEEKSVPIRTDCGKATP